MTSRRGCSEQGRLNLLELLAPAAAAGAPAAPAVTDPEASTGGGAAGTAAGTATARAAAAEDHAAAPAWTVSAPDIAVQGLKVSAEDRQVRPAAALLLESAQRPRRRLQHRPGGTLDITLDSAVNASGKINARAQVAPKSGALSAHIEAADLGLTALQPYVAQYTSMTLLKGALGARLDVERRADGALAVKGDYARSADLHTVDNALKQDFIKWNELRVADIRYRSQPASLRIGSVTALEPYVRMIIAPDRTLNITADAHTAGSGPQHAGRRPGAQGAGVAAVNPRPKPLQRLPRRPLRRRP